MEDVSFEHCISVEYGRRSFEWTGSEHPAHQDGLPVHFGHRPPCATELTGGTLCDDKVGFQE
jgi:hypothetical protein